jgi:L-threonylcarbamoyladenylate synthase
VFLPTDTVFGLAALPSRADAVKRIFQLKARPSEKNLPLMVSSIEQLARIGAQIDSRVRRLIASPFCPGPLSIAVGLNEKIAPNWLRGRDELAFRIPNDDFLLALLDRVGPLLVTSANRSGEGTKRTVEDAVRQLAGVPDLVIGGQECDTVPSTLVNCKFSSPKIERVGAVSPKDLAPYI